MNLLPRFFNSAVVTVTSTLLTVLFGGLAAYFNLHGSKSSVAVWLLLPVFGNMATPQEEAAQLDGASHFRIFLTILPMVAASTAAVGLVIFILCWNEYLFAAYLTSDKVSTLPAWIMGHMSIKEAQVGGDGDEWPSSQLP